MGSRHVASMQLGNSGNCLGNSVFMGACYKLLSFWAVLGQSETVLGQFGTVLSFANLRMRCNWALSSKHLRARSFYRLIVWEYPPK